MIERKSLITRLNMIFKRFNKIIISQVMTGAIIISLSAAAGGQNRSAPQPQTEKQRTAGQRLAPPSTLKCSRDHLTSFMGKVAVYQRSRTRIFLRVLTDEMTTENFTLNFKRDEDPTRHFLFRGEEFKANDLKFIELPNSKLRKPMRAIVWVCDDGSNPVIDWRPPER